MEGCQLRDRDAIALDLVGVVGLSGFFLGLVMLRASKNLGFDAGEALIGILGQLAVTLPAALLVLAATGLELAAGLVLARAARSRPFDSVAEALLAALVAAVLKDTMFLGLLGGFGLLQAPVLIALDLVVIAALWLPAAGRHLRPLTALGGWRDAIASIGSIPVAALVVIVWAGPVVLQLASPVVPFIDVLPNHVAPVEHIRTFGWFSPLTETQSPIQGPSRILLGYNGLLGSVATITDLSGGLAVAAFSLPLTLFLAAGAQRLARVLSRGSAPIGPWVLLTVALTQPFARLADVRGTVVVVPLICLGLAVAADALRRPSDESGKPVAAPSTNAPTTNAPTTNDPSDPWRIGRGAVVGLTIGAAMTIHPVMGFFALVTVAIVGLARPRELAATALVAALTAGLIVLPQLATMVGVSLPAIALGIALPAAVAFGSVADSVVRRSDALKNAIFRIAQVGRLVLLLGMLAVAAVAVAASFVSLDSVPGAIGAGAKVVLESSGLVLVVLIVGATLGSGGARSPIVLAGLAVGVAALAVTGMLPGNLGFLGDALRFEVPKTVFYWLSMVAAVGAAATLAHVWSTDRLPWLVRFVGIGTFVAVAALPLRPEPIDAYHLGEHRFSETFAIDLRFAGSGFWVGYPDSRTVVDEPRQQIIDAVRAEIAAGRLAHDTQVLHLADSFQQWAATPLGVFAGVIETSVTLKPEVSQHTLGGRLFGLDRLQEFLASGTFRYVVLEPRGLPDGIREQVAVAGYTSIFANDRGEVFVRSN